MDIKPLVGISTELIFQLVNTFLVFGIIILIAYYTYRSITKSKVNKYEDKITELENKVKELEYKIDSKK